MQAPCLPLPQAWRSARQFRRAQAAPATPEPAAPEPAAPKPGGIKESEQPAETEAKSDVYTDTMQKKMGTTLTYRCVQSGTALRAPHCA